MVLVQQRSILAPEGYDYADAISIAVRDDDSRSAEQTVRDAVGGVPRWLGAVVLIAHRHVLRLELAPLSAPNHLFGWQILDNDLDRIRLCATGPLLDGMLVARRVPPSSAVLETFVRYRRPAVARVVWAVVAPVHRAIVPILLCKAATAAAAR